MNGAGVCRMSRLADAIKKTLTACFAAVLIVQGLSRPPRACGQSSLEQEGLTLPIAVDIALRTNPLLRATGYGRDLADAKVWEAKTTRYPLLQVSETVTRSNNPVFVFGSLLEQGRFGPGNFEVNSLNNPDALSNFRTTFALRLPVFDQRQAQTRIAEARLAQEQADLHMQSIEQRVRFEVIQAYYAVLLVQAKKEVADQTVQMAEAEVKRIRDRFESGLVVQSDLLSAEVQLAEFRQQQIEADGDEATATAALNTALGLPVTESRKVKGELADRRFEVLDHEELIRLALLHRPDYAQAGSAVRSRGERLRGARGEFLPRLELFGAFGVSGERLVRGSSDYTVGASITFNLFDAGRAARIRQARAAEAIAQADEEHLANQIRLEVVRAFYQYRVARERLSVASRSVDQAGEALRIVQDRYQEGLTTITEVLRAESAHLRSRMNLVSARYDHYVGFANVLLVTGRLTDIGQFVS